MFLFTRKGQMEIMGLAIIVILISIGLLFFIQFALLGDSGQERQIVRQGLANNMVNALMETTTNCHREDMRSLIQDCQARLGVRCPENMGPCGYFSEVAEEMLNKTLGKWRYKYELIAYVRSVNNPLTEVGPGCPADVDKDSSVFFLTTKTGSSEKIKVLLDIC